MQPTTMITRILLLALAASVAVANAQEKPQGEKPRRERRGDEGGRDHGPNFERAGLTKEEAEKLKAAMEAAKQDPAVQAAHEAAKKAFEAVREAKEAGKTREEIAPLMKAAGEARKAAMEAAAAAVVAQDPSLQALIDKVKAARPKDGEGRGPKGGEGKGPRPERKKKDAGEAPAGA